MNLEHKFLTAFRNWLNETTVMVDYLLEEIPPSRRPSIKLAVKKTKGKRKYTKRSTFWQKPHPRKKP